MLIGLTGTFGSGKTTVAKMFAQFGAYVIDADKICHSLMSPSTEVYKKVVRYFGRDILKKDKSIDRKKLGKIVFQNHSKLNLLNKIVHPEAIKKIQKIIKSRKDKKIIIIDAAVLVESGFYKKMDCVIVVMAKKDVQIKRLINNWGLTRKQILQRTRMQAPLKKKLDCADFIIDNSGSKEQTKLQVEKIWRVLKAATDYSD